MNKNEITQFLKAIIKVFSTGEKNEFLKTFEIDGYKLQKAGYSKESTYYIVSIGNDKIFEIINGEINLTIGQSENLQDFGKYLKYKLLDIELESKKENLTTTKKLKI